MARSRFSRLMWRACWETTDAGITTRGHTGWMSEDQARLAAAAWANDWSTKVYVEGAVIWVTSID